jgi:uncharacterized membrane protein YcaP (DUF421 family)
VQASAGTPFQLDPTAWRKPSLLASFICWIPTLVVAAALCGMFGGGPVWASPVTRPTLSVLTSACIYGALLVLFRVVGKRTLAQITTFDVVLLLIISEATQQAMIGEDTTISNAVVAIATLASLDVSLTQLKFRHPRLEAWLEGVPVILVQDGKPLEENLRRERVDLEDLLESARDHGLLRLEEIKLAVLERTGKISIVPAS